MIGLPTTKHNGSGIKVASECFCDINVKEIVTLQLYSLKK